MLLGFLAMCIYGSIAEWFVHRVGMHTTHLSKWAFKRHAIDHHATRRSLRAFYAPEEERKGYEIMEASSVPVLWFVHIPLFVLIGYVWNVQAAIGAAIGAGLYITAYEVLHFYIHTPLNYWWQRTRMFHFYCEYHRLHHHRARLNYNIVCPLGDLVFRTFSLAEMPVEKSAPEGVPLYTGPGAVFGRKAKTALDAVPEKEATLASR